MYGNANAPRKTPVPMPKRRVQGDVSDYYDSETEEEATQRVTASDNFTISEVTDESSLESTTVTEKSITRNKIKKQTETETNCLLFKDAPEFNIESMGDVWRIVFYKAEEELFCFKLLIQRVTEMNGKAKRRHFLQGTNTTKGVFENIVLKKSKEDNIMSLVEQSPDQWFAVKNLLLMRDCDNGDIVIFVRLPFEPSLRDIDDALMIFGEDAKNGTFAINTAIGVNTE
ncbi:Uncharacterized protein OBRU01_10070 [Operophtera brumata]|uniref:Uncharacterized protein n=1 Tax=Operophtera brumata TaxID=104452 RepID=A0A0L7LE95_OPEBR|nr:Uncharacterized protein OBRU01_10070 [Operophtera brumata]